MKHLIVRLYVLLLLFFTGNTLSAQEEMPRLAVGATGGLQVSFMDFDVANNMDILLGGHGGIQLQYMSRKMLGFESSLLLTQIGWRQLDAVINGFSTVKITAIEIPLNSHLALGKGPLRFLIDAGPYLRFFTKTSYQGVNFIPAKSIDNNFSYGLNFGGGLGWRMPKLIIQLKGNFHLGLTNYFKPVIGDLTVSVERSGGGSISVLLPIGKKYIDE